MSEELSEFQKLKAKQPVVDDVLESIDGGPIYLTTSKKNSPEGKIAVFCHAIADVDQGRWVLTNDSKGIVCLILRQSFDKIYVNHEDKKCIFALKVVRYTPKGSAILAEVVS